MSTDKPLLKIKVVLVSGRGEELEAPPARVMLSSADHSLAELGEAIDLAFGRWDISHLHMFTLPNGSVLSSEDDD